MSIVRKLGVYCIYMSRQDTARDWVERRADIKKQDMDRIEELICKGRITLNKAFTTIH